MAPKSSQKQVPKYSKMPAKYSLCPRRLFLHFHIPIRCQQPSKMKRRRLPQCRRSTSSHLGCNRPHVKPSPLPAFPRPTTYNATPSDPFHPERVALRRRRLVCAQRAPRAPNTRARKTRCACSLVLAAASVARI